MKIFPPKISPIFLSKIRWRPKKKRSSLKFSPIFGPKLGAGQKGFCLPFVSSNLLLELQREWPCRNFAYYSMILILPWWPKGGSQGLKAPPKCAPGRTIANITFTLIFHLWYIMIGGNRGMLILKILCCIITFQFSLLCVYIYNQQKLWL